MPLFLVIGFEIFNMLGFFLRWLILADIDTFAAQQ